jgi:hypothetical protein
MFEHILNWKLQTGSHEFPGPDGGTCILEAAAVAAGFAYRSVVTIEDDLPECFSRTLASYAIDLNEQIDHDDIRQGLLPFVLRLSGTADGPLIEYLRAEFILVETVKRIVIPACCHRPPLISLRKRASRLIRLDQAYRAASTVSEHHSEIYEPATFIKYGIESLLDFHQERGHPMSLAVEAATYSALLCDDERQVWEAAFSILDDAIALGRHRVLEPDVVAARLEASKQTLVSA